MPNITRLTVAHTGADGDEYLHTYKDATFNTLDRPGFVSVRGIPQSGSEAGSQDKRTVHYPVDRIVRITEVSR